MLGWKLTLFGYPVLDWNCFRVLYNQLTGLPNFSDINDAFMRGSATLKYLANVAQYAEDNLLSYVADNPLEKNRRYTAFSIFH